MIVAAVDAGAVDDFTAAIDAEGARLDQVLTFGDRRVVLAAVASPTDAGPIAHRLRRAHWHALARPDDGAALDAWRRDTEPVVIGDRLAVVVAWSEHDRPAVPAIVELAPGGFGNGQHPTTRLSLEVAVATVRGGERVLDVGCGSGVLGLGALALGADHLTAVDLKPAAIAAARASAGLNGMEADVVVSTDSPASVGGSHDLVFANIAREGIAALATELIDAVAEGGRLVVSGVTPAQTDLIGGLLSPLVLVESRVEGDWAALVFSTHH